MDLPGKYALVLAGGGAKGAFQIGAWKAFRELGISFNAIIGTSVGALNGALIVQQDFEKAVELWDNISLEKIVSIPAKLIKEGKFHLVRENIPLINKLRKSIFKNVGFDTRPLKELLEAHVDEEKVRRSEVDFGLVTYRLSDLKPQKLFLEDIREGLLCDYLLASASFPGFKTTKIMGKQFIDGGVYDNLPYSMARERGYRRIIIVDISGPGISKRPDIIGTETIYIKNSIVMGSVLEFSQAFINDFMMLGYLDTLKVFGRIDGMKYFYSADKRIVKSLTKLLLSKKVIAQYRKLVKDKDENIIKSIRRILPREMKSYFTPLTALAECAALSLELDRIHLYSFSDFIKTIWEKYKEIGKKGYQHPKKHYKNIFRALQEKTARMSLLKDVFRYSPYEYEKAIKLIFGEDRAEMQLKALEQIFPVLRPAKVFFVLLEEYYST